MARTNGRCLQQPTTYEFKLSRISEISHCGREEVFDIQVARTENFIADGFVSHNTRWHEDDLAGRILRYEGADWRVLRLPAIAEDDDPLGRPVGEPLWSDDDYGYGAGLVRERERMLAQGESRSWHSLFQQDPYPTTGGFFEPDKIRILDPGEQPPAGQDVRAWDLAATAGGGDATVGLRLRRYEVGGSVRFCIMDVRRIRGTPEQVERLVTQTAAGDGRGVPIRLPQDPGQAGKMQVQYLVSRLFGYRVTAERPTGSKETRAASGASQVNVGNVSMVRAEWNEALLAELRAFPNGRHDDIVDALSDAMGALVVPARRAQWTHVNFMNR